MSSIFIPKRVVLFVVFLVMVVLANGQNNAQSVSSEKEVYNKLWSLDSALFSIVYTCDTAKASTYFTDDLEFYHDKGGLTKSKKTLLEQIHKNYCENSNSKLRRELVKGSMKVFLMDNYGAIQTGEHVFYYTANGQPEQLSGRASFTHLWQLKDNEWRITRVLSYDHGGTDIVDKEAELATSKKQTLYSEVLKENRNFQVLLPQDYSKTKKYDVVYVLDGEGNASMISQVQGFARESGFMPQTIIVGVHNVDRTRDFTPTRVEGNNSGGAANFLNFLQNELIPYVNKNYSVSGSNTLFGHSLGGLFAMYALLNKPNVFDVYLAADPSFWWDNNAMIKMTAEQISKPLSSQKLLWITGRGGNDSKFMGITAMDSLLRVQAPPQLAWKAIDYPGETHNSIKFKTIYDGIRYMYEGFDPKLVYHPMNGTVIKDKPYQIWYFSDLSNIRYTTDGSIPTKTSPAMQSGLVLNGPAELTLKSFSVRPTFEKTEVAHFKEGKLLKPVAKPKKVKAGGLHYSYYEGKWEKLPDFTKLKSLQSGFTDTNFRMDKLPKQTNFACLFEGYIEIKEEGYYIFGLDSDDGANLSVANQLIIDNDGLHGAGQEKSSLIYLQKGFYPIRSEYFQREGGIDLRLFYVLPGSKQPRPLRIPPEVLYGAE